MSLFVCVVVVVVGVVLFWNLLPLSYSPIVHSWQVLLTFKHVSQVLEHSLSWVKIVTHLQKSSKI